MTSGIVKTQRIGQSAGSEPNSVMLGYGSLSTTERVPVDKDGLSNLNRLKIQSTPKGNFGYKGPQTSSD